MTLAKGVRAWGAPLALRMERRVPKQKGGARLGKSGAGRACVPSPCRRRLVCVSCTQQEWREECESGGRELAGVRAGSGSGTCEL
jgi:hypothetical protein